MTEFSRRYGRLSDHLYKFIADMASAQPYPDWGEREDIEMALKFIKRLEDLHETERRMEEYERKQQRREQAKKKKADVVKLVDGNAPARPPAQ